MLGWAIHTSAFQTSHASLLGTLRPVPTRRGYAPCLPCAEMAHVTCVVANAAQWSLLPADPSLVGQSSSRLTIIAEPSRVHTAVDAWTAKHGLIARTQDLDARHRVGSDAAEVFSLILEGLSKTPTDGHVHTHTCRFVFSTSTTTARAIISLGRQALRLSP